MFTGITRSAAMSVKTLPAKPTRALVVASRSGTSLHLQTIKTTTTTPNFLLNNAQYAEGGLRKFDRNGRPLVPIKPVRYGRTTHTLLLMADGLQEAQYDELRGVTEDHIAKYLQKAHGVTDNHDAYLKIQYGFFPPTTGTMFGKEVSVKSSALLGVILPDIAAMKPDFHGLFMQYEAIVEVVPMLPSNGRPITTIETGIHSKALRAADLVRPEPRSFGSRGAVVNNDVYYILLSNPNNKLETTRSLLMKAERFLVDYYNDLADRSFKATETFFKIVLEHSGGDPPFGQTRLVVTFPPGTNARVVFAALKREDDGFLVLVPKGPTDSLNVGRKEVITGEDDIKYYP